MSGGGCGSEGGWNLQCESQTHSDFWVPGKVAASKVCGPKGGYVAFFLVEGWGGAFLCICRRQWDAER